MGPRNRALLLRHCLTVTAIEREGKRSKASYANSRRAGDAPAVPPFCLSGQSLVNLPQRLVELVHARGAEFAIKPVDCQVSVVSSLWSLRSASFTAHPLAPPSFSLLSSLHLSRTRWFAFGIHSKPCLQNPRVYSACLHRPLPPHINPGVATKRMGARTDRVIASSTPR